MNIVAYGGKPASRYRVQSGHWTLLTFELSRHRWRIGFREQLPDVYHARIPEHRQLHIFSLDGNQAQCLNSAFCRSRWQFFPGIWRRWGNIFQGDHRGVEYHQNNINHERLEAITTSYSSTFPRCSIVVTIVTSIPSP